MNPFPATARVGLVLAGGGAKGAYQVGVIQYLAEIDLPLAAVAGTSIGALNGTVVAAHGSPAAAIEHLRSLWAEVGSIAGAGITGPGTASDVIELAGNPVLRPDFVAGVVHRHIDMTDLRLAFWVTAFPSAPDDNWLADVARSVTGRGRSDWIKVNALPLAERREAILASAALPYIAPGRWVNGTFYRDGGLGGPYANTPAGPLAAEGPLDLILVTQLTRGVLWDAARYPDATILEIRPFDALAARGPVGSAIGLMDFSPRRMEELRRQGYQDAKRTLSDARAVLESTHERRTAQDIMLEAVRDLDDP
ncbi:hypothetical protein G9272_33760 [Streptomyces asoensis]|uniref:PNPLA domain-containing protein n=1 Tax=Streptomyces asoensis TaxID=249586 RepID=A0A6M4WWN2_9ACTN|nr:patatin-like phospholipase family protein [Streptomyces asoensis]QJT04658.1 hypothetical protein G9272_33760 [Streptomyces asoensis]